MIRNCLLLLAVFVFQHVCAEQPIPRQLRDKALKSDKFDSASIQALATVLDRYWDHSRDSILRCNEILAERESQYLASGFKYGLYQVYSMLGGNHKLLYNHAKSAAYFFQALKLTEAMGEPAYINRVRRELGLLYFIQSGWIQALRYFEPLIQYEEKARENIAQLNLYRYLAGLCHVRAGKPDKAGKLLKSAYNWAISVQDTQRILEYGTGYAAAMLGSGDKAAAAALYHTLLARAADWKDADAYFYATVYVGLSRIAMSNPSQLLKARDLARMALQVTEGKLGYYLPRIEAAQILHRVYKSIGSYDSALFFVEQWTHQKDSLESSENTAVMSLMQAAHDFDKREAALRIEERQKRLVMWVVAGVLFLLGVIVLLFYRSVARQKQRSEALLENILPKETILELKTFGHAIPRIHEDVTILFCDVRSFTTISEKLSPAALVALLDHYFRGFDEIVSDLGLVKIKTIGDAYMLVGGLHENTGNADSVVTAAIRMLEFVASDREALEQAHGYSFHFRVGIHTGSVISGVVGRDKYAYDIWGDAVNVAARMEQNSEAGKINVSGETWKRIEERFNGHYRGKIDAKNKGEVDMYFVTNRENTGNA